MDNQNSFEIDNLTKNMYPILVVWKDILEKKIRFFV